MKLNRSIGFVGLTFIAVSGIIGSGWIFGPLLTSQLAGPASIIAWGIGGLAMLIFRTQFPKKERLFKLPFVHLFAIIGFSITTLIIYWSAFKTFLFMLAALGLGTVIFMINNYIRKETLHSLDLRSALWIVPYIIGIGIISYTGNFGGQGLLSETVENLLIVVLSIGVLYLAVYLSLEPDRAVHYYHLQMQDEIENDTDVSEINIKKDQTLS